MRRITLPFLTFLLLAAIASVAHATPITYSYSATLVFDSDLGLAGDAVTGTVSFDDTVADSQADPSWAEYAGAGLSLTFNVGTHHLTTTATGLTQVFNDYVNGGLIFDSFLSDFHNLTADPADLAAAPYVGGRAEWGVAHAIFTADGPSNTPFTSTAIPTTLNIADFPALPLYNPNPAVVLIRHADMTRGVLSYAAINSLTLVPQGDQTPAPVPEPGTLSLVGLGGLALARRLRKR